MIYWELFLAFLKIGAVSFGGGYGMIPLIRETVVSREWMSEETLLRFIAVAESTPGPIAVNMATFIGSDKGGILGSFLATLGVVLPSFIFILLIAAVLKNLLKYKGVDVFLSGVHPCVVALIFSTAITLGLNTLLTIKTIGDSVNANIRGICILSLLIGADSVYRKITKKKLSPILMILLSGGLGILFYGL